MRIRIHLEETELKPLLGRKIMNENNGRYIILPVLAVAICFTMIFLESAEIVLPSIFRVAMLIAVLILIVIYIALKRQNR